jgi:hypothetical protein
MNNYLHISKTNRQKIPSDQPNLVGFEEHAFSIPRKTKFSGHFRLKTPTIFVEFLKITDCN